MLLRTVPISDNGRPRRAVVGVQFDLGSFVHSADSHGRARRGIIQESKCQTWSTSTFDRVRCPVHCHTAASPAGQSHSSRASLCWCCSERPDTKCLLARMGFCLRFCFQLLKLM